MFSGNNTVEYPTQWALNPGAYQNVSNEQVDWAALAQQWIQMKESCPPAAAGSSSSQPSSQPSQPSQASRPSQPSPALVPVSGRFGCVVQDYLKCSKFHARDGSRLWEMCVVWSNSLSSIGRVWKNVTRSCMNVCCVFIS